MAPPRPEAGGSSGGSWRSETAQIGRNWPKRAIGQRVENNRISSTLLGFFRIFRWIPKLDVAGSTPVARSHPEERPVHRGPFSGG